VVNCSNSETGQLLEERGGIAFWHHSPFNCPVDRLGLADMLFSLSVALF